MISAAHDRGRLENRRPTIREQCGARAPLNRALRLRLVHACDATRTRVFHACSRRSHTPATHGTQQTARHASLFRSREEIRVERSSALAAVSAVQRNLLRYISDPHVKEHRWRIDPRTHPALTHLTEIQHALIKSHVPRIDFDEHIRYAAQYTELYVGEMKERAENLLRSVIGIDSEACQLANARTGIAIRVDLASIQRIRCETFIGVEAHGERAHNGFIPARLERNLMRFVGRIDAIAAFVSTPRIHALNERAAAVTPAVVACKTKLKIAALDKDFFDIAMLIVKIFSGSGLRGYSQTVR